MVLLCYKSIILFNIRITIINLYIYNYINFKLIKYFFIIIIFYFKNVLYTIIND